MGKIAGRIMRLGCAVLTTRTVINRRSEPPTPYHKKYESLLLLHTHPPQRKIGSLQFGLIFVVLVNVPGFDNKVVTEISTRQRRYGRETRAVSDIFSVF